MDIRTLVKEEREVSNIPVVVPGDTVKVSTKFKEGDRERLQNFQGVVIGVKRGVDGGSFTVRRVSHGVGVERTFLFRSPLLEKVEVLRRGRVRRAKLYYMRQLSSKEARLKERREKLGEVVEEEVKVEEQ